MSVEWAIRTAALLTACALICRAMRPATAATRHALWRLTILLALTLPVATAIIPPWLRVEQVPYAAHLVINRSIGAGATKQTRAIPQQRAGASPAGVPQEMANRIGQVWAAGAAVVGFCFLIAYLHLGLLRLRAQPAPADWAASARRLALRWGLGDGPEVLVAQGVPGPLVTGVLRPAVLIPPAACAWHDARREAVLIHELAHVRRRDLVSQLAVQALSALHWFNPLVWHALREMRRDRELACDDEVLKAGVPPIEYAGELLAIAATSLSPRDLAGALSMARASELEGRLLAVLDGRRREGALLGRRYLSLVVVLVGLGVAGARLTPVTAATEPSSGSWPSAAGPAWFPSPESPDGSIVSRSADLISHTDTATRERATLALALASGPDAVAALLRALEDPHAGVREKAAIGLTWRRDSRVGSALIAAANDPDPRVREKVLVALAFSGDARAGSLIAAARQDPDSAVRDKAAKLAVLR